MSLTITPREDVILVDTLYTLDEAAQLLGLESDHWVRLRIKDGSLAYVDLNPNGVRPKYRVRASHLNQLIESLTLDASPRLAVAS